MKTCPQCQIKYPDVLEFCPRDGTQLPGDPAGKEPVVDPILDTTIDGRYAIESRLGEGGMGVVYKARHVLIDKPVAIKILRKEAAQDTAAVQRFIQEAKSASKINHSNIVDITDFGVLADGHAYFVMEFLQGSTLAQAIAEGPMESSRVCTIGAQMARGLHAAHTKGIVHRDLKPENIFLLEREGQRDFVKIVDFGIAKVGGGQKLTQVGMVLGTPEYMSPEQATGQETDHRVDQYAVGCIMYEMLTGAVPFLGERPAQTLTKHVFEPVIPPRKRKPEQNIPASLEAVVLRTMAKKPEQRFPSMRDLELALAQVESELKSGRVVIDDARLSNPPGTGLQNPSPPQLPAVPTFQPGQQPGSGPIQLQGQQLPLGMAGFPQPGPQALQTSYPPGTGPMGSAQIAATQRAGRPTQEGLPAVKARRVRSILAAVAGALLVVIVLLVYFLVSQEPVKPPPPPPLKPPPITEPVVPVKKPPVTVVEQPVLVTLQISSKPPGADVVIDGENRGVTPLRLSHKKGSAMHIEVRKKGFDSYVDDLSPEKDDNIDVPLEKQGRPTGKRDSGKKNTGKNTGKPKNGTGSTGLPSGLRNPFQK